MATCTFFGHKDTPQQANPILRATLIVLIENKNVNMFYVGNNGNFDNMVRSNLKSLKLDYPDINYAVVLAYITHPWGGAAQFKKLAEKKGKAVINLPD